MLSSYEIYDTFNTELIDTTSSLFDCCSSLLSNIYKAFVHSSSPYLNGRHIIKVKYGPILFDTLSLSYVDGNFCLLSEKNRILISSIFPSLRLIETCLKEGTVTPLPSVSPSSHVISLPTVPLQYVTPLPTVLSPTVQASSSSCQADRHQSFRQKGKSLLSEKKERDRLVQPNVELTDDERLEKLNSDPFEKRRELMRDERIKQVKLTKEFNAFIDDVKTYYKIKSDINSGLLLEDDLHPLFAQKYPLLKLLESRGKLCVGMGDEIDREQFELFKELYDDCYEEEKVEEEKVFVPHNYRYLSLTDKQKYAAKYDMLVDEFESRYVNIEDKTQDDIIGRLFDRVNPQLVDIEDNNRPKDKSQSKDIKKLFDKYAGGEERVEELLRSVTETRNRPNTAVNTPSAIEEIPQCVPIQPESESESDTESETQTETHTDTDFGTDSELDSDSSEFESHVEEMRPPSFVSDYYNGRI